jgi:hypothetical protein
MKPLYVALALLGAALLFGPGGFATAQQARQPSQPPPQPAQVQLTAKQIEGFIAAQKEIAAVTKKLPATPTKPDPKVALQLDTAAKKYGFKNFGEYDDVAGTIALVMSGIDPVSKTFMEPKDAIQQEIAEVNADKSIGKAQRAKMLQELNQALQTVQPIQHRSNIELVKSYFEKIEAAVP